MSRSKQIGTTFESGFVRYATKVLEDDRIHRSALAGYRDQGDIRGIWAHGFIGIAECKSVKEMNPARLERYKQQTITERGNANADFALLVVHEPGCDATGRSKSFGRNSVYMTLRDLTRICLGIKERTFLEEHNDEIWVRVSVDDALSMIGAING